MDVLNAKTGRCHWCPLKNEAYVRYHDSEWGVPVFEDQKLFEFLVLESFQAGLSWEIILAKREHFREAFDGFSPQKIAGYDEQKIQMLLQNAGIVRHRKKIEAAISNANVFLAIQKEWGSFEAYLWHFTGRKVIYETGKTHSQLSDQIAKDMKKRGMKFMGTTTVYAYLQAVGVINSHEPGCFLYRDK